MEALRKQLADAAARQRAADDEVEALRKQREADELAVEPSRPRAPRASIDWETLASGMTPDGFTAQLTEQARVENVLGFARQAWVPSKGGEVWTCVHRCPFFNERGV